MHRAQRRARLATSPSPLMLRGLAGRRQDGVETLLEGRLRPEADDLADRLATLDDEERRDAADPVLHRRLGVVVCVELAELDLARVLVCELLNDRRNHSARTAPGRPEVDQDRLVG